MAKFTYVARDPQGQTVRGSLQAGSLKGAMTGLLDRDLEVVDLKEKKSVLQFEITRKKLKLPHVMHFSRQLAAFVRAGVPLLEAIEVIQEEADDKTLRQVLQRVQEDVETGETFSGALQKHASLFPPFYVDMLRAAELTGTLDEVLEEMSSYIERDLEARNTIKAAMTYPAIILVFAIITTTVLSVYVLPRFKTFFAGFGAKLPLPTRMLIVVSNFFVNWWWAMIGGLFTVVVLLWLVMRTRRGRRLRDRLLLRVAMIGDIVRFVIVERFCRLLASMMDAGVPLPDALAVLAKGTNNLVFEEGLSQVREAMLWGDGLARPLAATKLFPGAVVQMIRVGEDTGTLGSQLETAARYYGKELQYKIKQLTSLFEPAVITLMGVIVGFVAIAMVSAMYGIYHQVNFS